jgi:hypothetical protein
MLQSCPKQPTSCRRQQHASAQGRLLLCDSNLPKAGTAASRATAKIRANLLKAIVTVGLSGSNEGWAEGREHLEVGAQQD